MIRNKARGLFGEPLAPVGGLLPLVLGRLIPDYYLRRYDFIWIQTVRGSEKSGWRDERGPALVLTLQHQGTHVRPLTELRLVQAGVHVDHVLTVALGVVPRIS